MKIGKKIFKKTLITVGVTQRALLFRNIYTTVMNVVHLKNEEKLTYTFVTTIIFHPMNLNEIDCEISAASDKFY